MQKLLIALISIILFSTCKNVSEANATKTARKKTPFVWEGATIYFLLTDRFYNADPSNDINFERDNETGVLRGFMGGDIKGIIQKINEGYFNDLGVNAIWFTPVVEQIHADTDEGSGNTYGYHGYWTKDWTSLDPNFGTKKDLEVLVKTAHNNNIRVIMDVVLNHTGPVTEKDQVWPKEWVREEPICQFSTYDNTVRCALVNNLPDILSESDTAVELPDFLLDKWKAEGRLSQELEELDMFFERTGYSRNPRAYIIKWLTDYVGDYGIDGFRVDTVKHVDEKAWAELYEQASFAFNAWKIKYPDKKLDSTSFYMMGEVYNYGISGGRIFDFGDKKVDYYNHGFNSLVNFELKHDAQKDYESIFSKYNKLLHTKLKGKSVVNYMTSHDDGYPFDKNREHAIKAATVLLLTSGASQIYYGDESARNLTIEGAVGDATLRSFMNWNEIDSLKSTKKILAHWKKLGQFRYKHLAVGAGEHKRLGKNPYVFSRSFNKGAINDKVVIGLDLPKGKKSIWVKGIFENNTKLYDAYSKTKVIVKNNKVILENDYDIALLELLE